MELSGPMTQATYDTEPPGITAVAATSRSTSAEPPPRSSNRWTVVLFALHSFLIGGGAALIATLEVRAATPWPYVIVGLVFATLGALLQISLAWIYFPLLHRGGTLAAGVLAALHPVARTTHWLILVAVVPVAFVESRDYLHHLAEDLGVMTLLLLVTTSAWAYIALVSRTVHRAAPAMSEIRSVPRCDGCGYDLSHAGELCPECNLPVADSLLPERRRSGQPWDRAADSWPLWAKTSLELLFRPRRFFPRLEVQTTLRAARQFRNLHLRWIAAIAPLWLSSTIALGALTHLNSMSDLRYVGFIPAITLGVVTIVGLGLGRPAWPSLLGVRRWESARAGWLALAIPLLLLIIAVADQLHSQSSLPGWMLIPMLISFSLASALVAWGLHRLVAALACTAFFSSRPGFDGRVAEKALSYEIVFAWVLCIFWAAFLTSIVIAPGWISNAFGSLPIRGASSITGEAIVLIGGTTTLCVVWCLRMWRALQRVEYSNF